MITKNVNSNSDESLINKENSVNNHKVNYSNTNNNIDNRLSKTIENLISQQFNNRLYGSFWLLIEISKKIGLYDDLLTTFDNNIFKTHEILSLSLFPFLSGKNFNRFSKWQNTHKTLIDYQLTSYSITRLCQGISDNERMHLIELRINRLPSKSCVDCDSTTRSTLGKGLADIQWGRNKDNEN